MSRRSIYACLVIVVLLFISCSVGRDHPLHGKWVINGRIVGSSPTSYWFQKNGKVIAPWEERAVALKSSGSYEFIDNSHIKIHIKEGYFKGITFFFEIVKVDSKDLILRGSIQDIKMKKVG